MACVLVACSSPSEDAPAPSPNWDAELELAQAVDENSDPAIFETTLVARPAELELVPGKRTQVWTYNGSLPGPLLRVSRGARLIVHFENQLPEATTIHWHGIRLPNEMDGVPDEPQPAIEPGGRFDYDFVVPDSGTFWYHPHQASAAQVGYGLYGALIVEDPEEPADLGDEIVLVLSDAFIDENGALGSPDSGGELGTLFGREGNTLLVNGRVNPALRARSGRRQRWRIVNAARSRYYQLLLSGQSFTRIGGDHGFLGAQETSDRILVIPGQRADVIVDVQQAPGVELPLRWVPYPRGFGSVEFRDEETVLRLVTTAGARETPPPLPRTERAIAPLDLTRATPQLLELTRNDRNGVMRLGVNGVPAEEASPLMAALGDTQLWTVRNTIDWAHPFHLHGFFFQVLDETGSVPPIPEWRDTADVPVNSTLRLAVHFDERPGMWMFHCHILDHADAGMMGMVHVHP